MVSVQWICIFYLAIFLTVSNCSFNSWACIYVISLTQNEHLSACSVHCTPRSCNIYIYQTHGHQSVPFVPFWECGAFLNTGWWQEGGECTSLTRPTSTSLVIMTMLKQFSCHTILQKSYRVSCLGPSEKREGITERDKNVTEWKPTLPIRQSLLLWNIMLLRPKCPSSDRWVMKSKDCAVTWVTGNSRKKWWWVTKQ